MKSKLAAFCLGLMITGGALTASAAFYDLGVRPLPRPRPPRPDPIPTFILAWSSPTQTTCIATPHDCVVDIRKPGGVVIVDVGQVADVINTPLDW